MNTFLKSLVGVAYIASTANMSYAAESALASKNACTANAACISDLADYISTYDGLTAIKDLGGPIETAQQLVYGGFKDGSVTRAEVVDPTVKFVFPSSRPELYGRVADDGAPSCTAVGSVPMRANSPITEEDVRNGRGVHRFGGSCVYDGMYDAVMRTMIGEEFQPYDTNKDGVISKVDDRNKDNMITLEDTVFGK